MSVLLKQFTKVPNAGDVASKFLVERILGTEVQLIGEKSATVTNLIAVGSILQWADQHSVIWGTGLIRPDTKPARPHIITAVRGLLTRRALMDLGIECPAVFGDPGILISDFHPPSASKSAGETVGLIPHYVDIDSDFVRAAADQGAMIIDPALPLTQYLDMLTSCSIILSSSLHGIIFAHSYGIPAAWVKISDKVHGDGFKFRDYYTSVGFDADEVNPFTIFDESSRIVDGAKLPRRNIDRDVLRSAITEIGDLIVS